jgi:TonB family protein
MKEKKDKFVKMAYYEGGEKAMFEFIKNNLVYPVQAIASGKEGSVHLSYVVNDRGLVTDVKIISGLGNVCDDEAVKVVKLLKFTVPPNKVKNLTFNKKISIHFHLPKISDKPAEVKPNKQIPQSINYNYIVTTTTPNPVQEEKSSNYVYSIDLK